MDFQILLYLVKLTRIRITLNWACNNWNISWWIVFISIISNYFRFISNKKVLQTKWCKHKLIKIFRTPVNRERLWKIWRTSIYICASVEVWLSLICSVVWTTFVEYLSWSVAGCQVDPCGTWRTSLHSLTPEPTAPTISEG